MPRVNYEVSSTPKTPVVAGKRVSPLGTQARDAQAKAMDKLIAERQAYVTKHGGNYPSDAQLEASRKNK
jgi:hypothetical protein